MRTIERLDELADLVDRAGPGRELYVRWSRGPDRDVPGGNGQSSRDTLTGVRLPGLSANSLRVESWWGDRPLKLWVARRLYDYRHLREARGPGGAQPEPGCGGGEHPPTLPGVRPWVLEGEENGRGPDNEPLVICRRPLAWIGEAALRESDEMVAEQGAAEWGPLDRR
jgi:hypothetical protein